MSEKKNKSEKRPLVQRLVSVLFGQLRLKKKEQSKVRNEFRFNLSANHPNYVFYADKEKDHYAGVGITHEEETFERKNAPLQQNPKKGKTEQSYLRNGIVTGGHQDYSRKTMKNMEFSKEDMPNVKAKIRNYKKEQKKRK